MGCAQSTPVADEFHGSKHQSAKSNGEASGYNGYSSEGFRSTSINIYQSNSVSSPTYHSSKFSEEESSYILPIDKIAAELTDLFERHDSVIERKNAWPPSVLPDRYHEGSKPKMGIHRRVFSMESISPNISQENTHERLCLYRELESLDSTTKPAMLEHLKRAFQRKDSLQAWSKSTFGKEHKKQKKEEVVMDKLWGTSPHKKMAASSLSASQVSPGNPHLPHLPTPLPSCDFVADMFEHVKEDIKLERPREKNRRFSETTFSLENIAELQNLRMERRRKSLNDAGIPELVPWRQGRMGADQYLSLCRKSPSVSSSEMEDAIDWRKEEEDDLGPLPSPGAITSARKEKQIMQQQQDYTTVESVDINSLMEGIGDEEENLGNLDETSSFNSDARIYSVSTNSEKRIEKVLSCNIVESSQMQNNRLLFEQSKVSHLPVEKKDEMEEQTRGLSKLNLYPNFMSTCHSIERHMSEQDNYLYASSESEPFAPASSAISLWKDTEAAKAAESGASVSTLSEKGRLSQDVCSLISQQGTPRSYGIGRISSSSSSQSQEPKKISKQMLLAAVKKAHEAVNAAGWDEEEDVEVDCSTNGGRKSRGVNNCFDLEMMACSQFHDQEAEQARSLSSSSPFKLSTSETRKEVSEGSASEST